MPREKKFSFLPVRNDDLRKIYKDDDDETPYVRIQKPGLLVFPKKTLQYFKIEKGKLNYLRFYIDVPKRALAFKFIDKGQAEEFKELRPLAVTQTTGTTQGIISIKSILNQFGEWQMPVRCNLDMYDDQDEYISLGKMNYFIIPKPQKVGTKEETE